MATIFQRGDKWTAQVRIKGVSKFATFERHSDAKAWAARIETEIIDGIQGNTPKGIRLYDLLEKYLNEITPTKRGERTERHRIAAFMRHSMADMLVSDIRPQDIALWRDARLKEVSNNTVLRHLGTLSAVFEVGIRDWGMLRDNPVKKIRKPAAGKARDRRPTIEEIEKICFALSYSDDEPPLTRQARIGAAMLFAIETAMRAHEICSLKWDEIDFNRRVAHIPITKNGHPRDVPLSRRALEILRHLKAADIKDDRAFAVNTATLDSLYRRARDFCEIDDLHFHDTRREALTRMSKKVNVMDLAKISGHRDIKILQNVYYNPDISTLVDLLD